MSALWAVGAIVLLLLLIHLSTAGRDLADVGFLGTDLVVTPKGLNKIWALRGRITIPKSCIRSAGVISGRENLPIGWRWPGTALPGLILAGTYWKNKERSFYVLRDFDGVVLLELEGHKYARVGIQARDPLELVERINSMRTAGTTNL
jgi:hypothetical protein